MTKRANVKTKKDALINQGIGTFVPTPNRALSRLCEEEQLSAARLQAVTCGLVHRQVFAHLHRCQVSVLPFVCTLMVLTQVEKLQFVNRSRPARMGWGQGGVMETVGAVYGCCHLFAALFGSNFKLQFPEYVYTRGFMFTQHRAAD